MDRASALLLNYSISLAALCFAVYFLIQKSKTNPGFRYFGLSVNNVIKIAFLGIGLFLALIVLTLLR